MDTHTTFAPTRSSLCGDDDHWPATEARAHEIDDLLWLLPDLAELSLAERLAFAEAAVTADGDLDERDLLVLAEQVRQPERAQTLATGVLRRYALACGRLPAGLMDVLEGTVLACLEAWANALVPAPVMVPVRRAA